MRERLPPFTLDRKELARFGHVESCESEDGRKAIEEFWQTAVASRCEGLMIKVFLSLPYIPCYEVPELFHRKLLDNGEVLEDADSKKEKVRRKPLPATYEPGMQEFVHRNQYI